MRAETIIATHANTDFDAFASMLAVRRLYPGSVVCVSGSLNRNVRELCRLYADELELVEASRLELDAVRRLIVVEAVNASRLGELEPVALDPAVEKVVFDHHAGESPDWARPDNVVLSEDGALTTTLVGILAEREIAVSALEATVFALGIHEDTGSLTYPSATQRDADALSWCLRHGARQDLLGRHLHTPLSEEERALLDALVDALETHELPGLDALVAAISWPSYVEGVSNLAHKIVDLTDARALVLLVEMDSRVFCVVRSRTPSFDAAAAAGALGGGGHEQAASAIYRGPLADAQREILAALPAAVSEPLARPRRHVEAGPRRRAERQRRRRDGALPALQPERRARDGQRQARRLGGPRGSRPGDRARAVPRSGQRDHERPRARDRRRCPPVRAAAAARRLGGGQDRYRRRGSGRGRGHP